MSPEKISVAPTCVVMMSLPGELRHELGNHYRLRTWMRKHCGC